MSKRVRHYGLRLGVMCLAYSVISESEKCDMLKESGSDSVTDRIILGKM